MKFYALLGLLALLAFGTLADDTNEVSDKSSGASPKTTQAVATTKAPSDSINKYWPSFTSGYGTAVAAGGVVVVGVVVLLAIAAVVSPLFGYKLCQIFSTCEGSPFEATAYSLQPDANQGTYPAPYGNNVYKKRSVDDTVGPILQILSSAYQKYGHAMQGPAMQGPVYDRNAMQNKNTNE